MVEEIHKTKCCALSKMATTTVGCQTLDMEAKLHINLKIFNFSRLSGNPADETSIDVSPHRLQYLTIASRRLAILNYRDRPLTIASRRNSAVNYCKLKNAQNACNS